MKERLKEIYQRIALFFRKERYEPKVFCIGFNKTGTTTVGKSFELLGYRNSSFNKHVWRKLFKKGRIEEVIKYTAKFESFDDLPWLREEMIPILDQRFPGSKWVYLERDEESWKKSKYEWTYKMTGKHLDMDKAYAQYLSHREFVLDYFKDRGDDEFIILTVKDPEGFKKLGEFLGRPSPQEKFPHFNETAKFKKVG